LLPVEKKGFRMVCKNHKSKLLAVGDLQLAIRQPSHEAESNKY